ncbi:hypothetical protein DICVIV_06006 [Dictyocaulus viviparus]|uniref:Uncharacterized protein n=1 Tax=Dictyocaulus viviparus TaxID=29172 RepID=A0A0D8XTE0_DICVI|nr:hypothetical protein DICVIV_06006 [Dictyocaulus viviparus]
MDDVQSNKSQQHHASLKPKFSAAFEFNLIDRILICVARDRDGGITELFEKKTVVFSLVKFVVIDRFVRYMTSSRLPFRAKPTIDDDDSTEIVYLTKLRPRSHEQLYEAIPIRRNDRREIILLEPIGSLPDTIDDDYVLYRMEEFVDVSGNPYNEENLPIYFSICTEEPEPVFYKMEKFTEYGERISDHEVVVDEQPSSTKEIGTNTSAEVDEKDHVEEQIDTERYSIGSHYVSPLIDRTIYHEYEMPEEKTPEQNRTLTTHQTYYVDEDIINTNRKVDSVLQDRGTQGISHQSIRDDIEKKRVTQTSMEKSRRIQEGKSEFVEPSRMTSEKSDLTHTLQSKMLKDSTHHIDYRKDDRSAYASPSRSMLVTRSSRTASNRSTHSPCCQYRKLPHEYEEAVKEQRKSLHNVPIRRETTHSLNYHHIPHHSPHSTVQKTRSQSSKSLTDNASTFPIHEVITTEKFERVERVRRRIPGTLV